MLFRSDAFISLSYAANLLAGRGFVLTRGAPEIEGVTNLGWTVLLAGLGAIMDLQTAAKLAGLDTLFEVHDEAELARALRHDPDMVGVNNRNLSTFQIDLGFAERVIPQMPRHILKVAESGIKTPDDARRMRAAGAHALLVGESLMRAADPTALLQAFRHA